MAMVVMVDVSQAASHIRRARVAQPERAGKLYIDARNAISNGRSRILSA